MAARLVLNQEVRVRVLPWQRRSDAKSEAFFGTGEAFNAPGNRTSGDGVLGSYVVVVFNGQHASPPRWRNEFESRRPHWDRGVRRLFAIELVRSVVSRS